MMNETTTNANNTVALRSNFFNNKEGNTLFNKLKGIAQEMPNFDRFLSVVGYFRSSGYFKLRKELNNVKEIKILVGINVDKVFAKRSKQTLFSYNTDNSTDDIIEEYKKFIVKDIAEANYSKEIEDGIMQLIQDLADHRLQIKIHKDKNLHAKFYLCLPTNHTPNSDGWVIMGSSNISDSGLGIDNTKRYELNVAMKDYDDVAYCLNEFNTLWEEAIDLTETDVQDSLKKTHLTQEPPTPYELYLKVLIETFGKQVEDDFELTLPSGVKDLKYQKDAVIQGYQMLMQHNGIILADVVGLGKTMIAAMICKRFIAYNGRNTNILVIYPPALKENWVNTFELFKIKRYAQFVTNGSLDKVLEQKDQYKSKEEFDIIIVDEAHGFRSDNTEKYNQLQKICKAPCDGFGLLKNTRKKVILLSATPINNSPEDLKNLLLLFEDVRRCTIEGISNLESFFAPYIKEYKNIITTRENDATPSKNNDKYTEQVDEIYNVLREKIIDKITIRRTRTNITNNPEYKKDLEAQQITFPKVCPPKTIIYNMNSDLENLFYETLRCLSDETAENHLSYARYRAIEFLVENKRQKYQHAQTTAHSLATIYKIHIVKRLESSFNAFKISLGTLLRITNDMIRMYEEDQVIIAPELNISKELEKNSNVELDTIIKKAVEQKGYDANDIVFSKKDFTKEFYDKLQKDQKILNDLTQKWDKVNDDPKLDEFLACLNTTFMNKETNPSHKLVIFSESVDTINYLSKELEKRNIKVLKISSENRDKLKTIIQQNFDANYHPYANDYDIIISSDVLAEGVNLHRSNVIINYDSPWNATRLMQRIGRVNRIGSTSEYIHNYVFYPSDQGNRIISLYKNALVKLQGFHSAFGEDAQIFSTEEIVKQFELYNLDVKDSTDKRIQLLNEIKHIYLTDRKLYNKIKKLPIKSRSVRQTSNTTIKDASIVFICSDIKTDYYLVTDDKVQNIDFLTAVDYFKAPKEELPVKLNNRHYAHITRANEQFKNEYSILLDKTYSVQPNNPNSLTTQQSTARNFLNILLRREEISKDEYLKTQCQTLREYVLVGTYTKLITKLSRYGNKYNNHTTKITPDLDSILSDISKFYDEYKAERTISQELSTQLQEKEIPTHQIIVSETFV